MLVRIKEDYKPIEGWQVGDVVDITNPDVLLEQGKVERVEEVVAVPVDAVAPTVISEPAETVISEPVVRQEEVALEALTWNELRKLGKEEGLKLRGMSKADIIEALK